jgi:AraC family transcriptional regulator
MQVSQQPPHARSVRLHPGPVSVVAHRCTAGPGDRPFAEQHRHHSLSYVQRGSFGCHCRGRRFELLAGSLFVGHPGDEYTCTHEHAGGGDECLSFQFTPELVDEIGGDARAWQCGAMPPLPALVVLGQLAQAAAVGRADVALDELGLLIAARFVGLHAGRTPASAPASARDRQRALRAAQWIESHSTNPVVLQAAAAEAAWSPYHFLRVFARVFGLTPHQYLIRCRLRDAARLLAEEAMPVTEVALSAGFADLSNFVRSFGKAAGMPPLRFRRLARGEGRALRARLALPTPH